MFKNNIDKILTNLQDNVISNIEFYLPKIILALVVLGIGILIAIGIYKLVKYLFKKFKIVEFIDKLNIEFDTQNEKLKEQKEKNKKIFQNKISDKIKIDKITAKAFSYYIFLVFFKYSIKIIGIEDVENFLKELLIYLPHLFIGILVGFFGIRFANFIYDITFHTLNLTKQKTAKIIASGAKIIILFFTLMVVLDKVGITGEITTTILIGFISMLAIAGGLAFGLGGRDIAKEILENLKK